MRYGDRDLRIKNREWFSKYFIYRETLFAILGGKKCSNCGSLNSLEIHHVYHNGKSDRKKHPGLVLYRYYCLPEHWQRARKRLKILCFDCHTNITEDHWNNGEYRPIPIPD